MDVEPRPLRAARACGASRSRRRLASSPTSAHAEAGHSVALRRRAALRSAAGDLFDIGYNQVFIDPVTGASVGKREWGAVWPISSETFVSFLYVLHYSLHIPEFWGIDHWGLWLMGGIALIWTIDCFVGFYLTLPARRERARQPRRDRRATSGARLLGALVAGLAHQDLAAAPTASISTSIARLACGSGLPLHPRHQRASLNLYDEVALAGGELLLQLHADALRHARPSAEEDPIEPKATFETILRTARGSRDRRGWSRPPATSSTR